MSYEFGFAKYRSNQGDYSERNIYFFWCGWENVELHNLFAALGKATLVADDEYGKYYDYKIPVEKLAFIEPLYRQVAANEHYNIIMNLCRFNDDFVEEYINDLTVREMAKLKLAFLLDDVDMYVESICVELFDKFEYGYDMVGALYEAYQKMKKDDVEFVWLYG